LRILPFALLCLAPGVAMAQPSPAPFTVDDAVALAIRQNPRLSAAAREVAASRSGVRSARALANPSLTFTPAFSPGGADEELLFQQPLELNGTRSARTGVASAQSRVAQAEAIVTLRDLVFDTKTAYYELARAQELRSLAGDLIESAQEFDRITRRQVEVGSRPGIDQTQTGIEVSRARQQVTLAESQVTTAQTALNTLMGRPPDEPVGPLPPLAAATAPLDREKILRQALAARAEIAAAEATHDAFRQEARLARAQGRPDLTPQFRAGSVTRGFGDSGVGVGITLPLFDYGSRRHRIRQAEESARAQEDRIAATRSEVRQEVEQALARLQAADAVVRDYQGGVLEGAQRLLQATRTGFQAGATSVIAILEAQRTYRSVLTDYTNALAAAASARAELERATGAVPADLLPAVAPQARSSQ
jgi:cobalt-zinc-cadmium efflux system outer membrane protein